MRRIIARLRALLYSLFDLDRRFDEIKMQQGLVLCELQSRKAPGPLSDFEFKVFSQWGEDGIIQHLVRNISIANRTFIEFGIQDFFESNGRFLLMKDHWQGFVIDGSPSHIARLQSSYFYWQHPLQSEAAFIDRDNVIALLQRSGFDKDLGILSIDVDGVDYHLLERLSEWTPRIVIVEYNALFGSELAVTIPYDPTFRRTQAHYSNLYFGASLPAFQQLLDRRGYGLVGINSVGSNAFFVRRDVLTRAVPEVEVATCFRQSTFREARDEDGRLLHISALQGRKLLADLPVIDLRTNAVVRIGGLFDEATHAT